MPINMRRHITYIPLIIISLCAIYRFSVFMLGHTLDFPIYDMIPVLHTLISKPPIASLFLHQHGAHFQGIGYIVTSIALTFNQWNLRVLTLLSVIIQIGTYIGLMLLTRRLFGSFALFDLTIPLSTFAFKFFELFIVIPNVSSGVLPVFLLSILGLVLTLNSKWRTIITTLLGILLIFSGYGMFAAAPITLLLIRDVTRADNKRFSKFLLFGNALLWSSAILFFWSRYIPTGGVVCSISSINNYHSYMQFLGTMMASSFVDHTTITPMIWKIGLSLFVYFVFISILSIVNLFKSPSEKTREIYSVQLLFSSFSILFIVFATVGRACLGVNGAFAPRYSLMFIPGIISLYYSLRLLNNKTYQYILCSILIYFLIYAETHTSPRSILDAKYYQQMTNQWKRCYLYNKSISYCTESTNFELIENSQTYLLEELLWYAQSEHLLFSKINK